MNRLQNVGKRIEEDVKSAWQFMLALVLYDVLVQSIFHKFCPVVIVTGLPCPGCGVTRAVEYFVTGQFQKGWAMHPFGIAWLFLGVYFCVMRYLLGRPVKGLWQMAGLLAAGMIVFWIYRLYRFFPGAEPICYTAGNLMERAHPGYGELVCGLIRALQRLVP